MKLKRTQQCAQCPWRKDVDPFNIPNGYDPEKHAALTSTIAEEGSLRPVNAMSCHEHEPEEEVYCVGWLIQQLNQGNNIPLRMIMRLCENINDVKLVGDQHETFEDTLPKGDEDD